jgi:hypothetical protein
MAARKVRAMKLPDLPPVYLRPPDVKRAVLMCEVEKLFRHHEYAGKDAVWGAGNELCDLRIRFRCEECGHVRHYGSEVVGIRHTRTDEAAEAAVARELAEAVEGG